MSKLQPKPGPATDRRGQPVMTPDGYFNSIADAARAYGVSRQAAAMWVKNGEPGWHTTRARRDKSAVAWEKRRRAESADIAGLQVGTELRKWREKHGIRPAVAAEILGISPRTLQGLEGGRPCAWPRLLLAHIRLLDKYDELYASDYTL